MTINKTINKINKTSLHKIPHYVDSNYQFYQKKKERKKEKIKLIKNPLKKPKLNPLFSQFLFQRNKNTRNIYIKKKNKNTQNLPFQPNNFAPKGFRPDPRFAIVEWPARVKGWRPAKERKKKFEEGETTRESKK